MPHETLGRYSYVAADPFAWFEVDGEGATLNGERMPGPPLAALRAVMSRFPMVASPVGLPFQGGAIGMIGYDFAQHLEHLDRPPNFDVAKPLLRVGLYDTVFAFDHRLQTAVLYSSGYPAETMADRRARAEMRLNAFEAALAVEPSHRDEPSQAIEASWTSNFDEASYGEAVEAVREHIRAGNIYQANIAQRFSADLPPGFDPFALYLRLRQTNPAPFAAFLDYGDVAIASSSPERFLKLGDRQIETRPIKGTAPRFATAEADRASAEALLASSKDRAENIMIVDLLRNDLARVADPDSVEVPVLRGLESYASVHHLTSVVTARLREGADAYDLIGACFPGGSITGAPKIRAMDIITQIERHCRGAYCGSIGFIGFDGTMDLNIAIRTVTFEGSQVHFQAGGGITILSDPVQEYRETLAKAVRIFAAFEDETP